MKPRHQSERFAAGVDVQMISPIRHSILFGHADFAFLRKWVPVIVVSLLVQWLLPQTRSAAQSLPVIGDEATFDVVSWNIEWFGDERDGRGPANDSLQRERVRQIVTGSDADLWALQEITDRADFDALLEALGDGYSGRQATRGGDLYTAFLYRNDVVFIRDPGAVRHILTDQTSWDAFAERPPLLMEASIRAPDGSYESVVVINLHMKAGADPKSYEDRKDAADALRGYLDLTFPDSPVIVLGDFNDILSGSITPGRISPFLDFQQRITTYRFASRGIGTGSIGSWCPNASCTGGSVIDHILITNELFDRLSDNSAFLYDAPLDVMPGYVATVSDHLPVYARFSFSTPVADATDPIPSRNREPGRPFPSPASDRVTIPFDQPPAPGSRIVVYDALGGLQYERTLTSVGTRSLMLDCAGWPSGWYMVVFEDGGNRTRKPLIVAH